MFVGISALQMKFSKLTNANKHIYVFVSDTIVVIDIDNILVIHSDFLKNLILLRKSNNV